MEFRFQEKAFCSNLDPKLSGFHFLTPEIRNPENKTVRVWSGFFKLKGQKGSHFGSHLKASPVTKW